MPETNFRIQTQSSRDARNALRQHRAGRGGRVSKFEPVLEEIKQARKGQVVSVEGVHKNQVQTLRSFIYRHLDPEKIAVKSAREKEKETYAVMIGHTDDLSGD